MNYVSGTVVLNPLAVALARCALTSLRSLFLSMLPCDLVALGYVPSSPPPPHPLPLLEAWTPPAHTGAPHPKHRAVVVHSPFDSLDSFDTFGTFFATARPGTKFFFDTKHPPCAAVLAPRLHTVCCFPQLYPCAMNQAIRSHDEPRFNSVFRAAEGRCSLRVGAAFTHCSRGVQASLHQWLVLASLRRARGFCVTPKRRL
jgi:hypothetical protein